VFSVAQFNAWADLFPEAMLLIDGTGAIHLANRSATRQLSQIDLGLGQTVLGDLCIEPGEQIDRYLHQCRRTTSFIPATLTFQLPDSSTLSMRCEGARCVFNEHIAPCHVVLRLTPKQAAETRFTALNQQIEKLAHEVDLRRRAELDLIEQRERFRVTLASIGDGVIATDVHGVITFLNGVAESHTGWQSAQAIGQPIEKVFRIVNDDTRLPVENPVKRVIAEGITLGLANHTILIQKDGSELHIDDSGAPIRNAEGATLGAVLVFHDITERWRLEQQITARTRELEIEHQRKDEFLAMLGHELRNPLAPIKSALELQAMPNASDDIRYRAMGIMNRQITHLTRLVDELLDVGRISSGKIILQSEVLDIGTVIRRAIELTAPLIQEKRHTLISDIAPEVMHVKGDLHRLTQVVGNVLNNAAKYTEHNGTIHLSSRRVDEQVEISVQDNGMGIPAMLLPRVFDIFTQSERALARSEGGLGVGLTVVRRLVEQHSGTVTVYSDGPGKGSHFRILLPLASAPLQQHAHQPASPITTDWRKILVVDDNNDAATMLAEMLRLLGNEVRVASAGEEAISMMNQEQPHVVLLDIGLPGMDGYAIARTLRANIVFTNVSLIAVTGYGQPEDLRKSREAGFDHHLVKPIDMNRLQKILAEIPAIHVLS
jgi:PAS domain S-box-containing protein